MADVAVTTFAEFRTAAAQSGNTIICPEGAIWDMSEIDPDNTITSFEINSNVTGNNTEIRNFRGKIICGNSITITALHIINQLCETGSDYTGAIYTASRTASITMQLCRLSIATGTAVENALYNVRLYKCAANISMLYAGNCDPVGAYYNIYYPYYNCITINAPNASQINGDSWLAVQRSKIIINAPLATKIFTGAGNSTIRGNMPNVTASSGSISPSIQFDVINAASAPNFPASTSYMLRVTDAQMRDADYLASIGFVIGTE